MDAAEQHLFHEAAATIEHPAVPKQAVHRNCWCLAAGTLTGALERNIIALLTQATS